MFARVCQWLRPGKNRGFIGMETPFAVFQNRCLKPDSAIHPAIECNDPNTGPACCCLARLCLLLQNSSQPVPGDPAQ